MGNAAIVACRPQRRYRNGMYAHEYWDEVAWPDTKDTLEVLSLSHDKARVIFDAFVAVDQDNSGEMTVHEFHDYLGVPQTKFSERIFGVLDMDGSGALDFFEFSVGVWNYCTYDVKLITKLSFDIFDVDRCGKLEACECDALLRMVYDVDDLDDIEGPPSGLELLAEIDVNGDGDVTLDEFTELMESHSYILAPAFDLQRALRQRILGVRFWEAETRVRQALFSGYDASENDSWEAIKEILEKSAKDRERLAEEELARQEASLSEEEKKKRDREAFFEHEREGKEARRLAAEAENMTEEDRAEQEAAQWLADAIAEMDTDCLFEDLAWRRGARQRLWEAFSHAEACANAAHVKRKEVEVARAESADAETVLEEQLKTEEGSARHKYLMQLQFGEDLFKEWSSSPGFKAQLAPMFKSPDGKLISVAAVAYLATMASKSSSKAASEAAKKLLLEEVRVNLRKRAEKAAVRQHKKSMAEFARAKEDLTGSFGGPNTMWEKLFDPSTSAPFWYHTGHATTVWDEPAVCHVCDVEIDDFDVKCFSCQAERSRYNRELYRGPSTLPPLPDDAHTVADGSDDDDSYGDGDSADGVSVAGGDEDGGNEDQDGSGSDEDSD